MGLGEPAAETEPELVNECFNILHAQQRRLAHGRAAEIADSDNDRTDVFSILDALASTAAGPGAGSLGRLGAGSKDAFRQASQVLALLDGQLVGVRLLEEVLAEPAGERPQSGMDRAEARFAHAGQVCAAAHERLVRLFDQAFLDGAQAQIIALPPRPF